MPKSAADLKKYALLKMKLQQENEKLAEDQRLSQSQIENRARQAIKHNLVNDYGNLIESKPWDFNQAKR